MKTIIYAIIAFGFGLAVMYLYLGKGFSVVNQLSLEINISNNIRYLELLEQGKVEPLKEVLKRNIDCSSAEYEKNLESLFWDNSQSSQAILKQAEPYKGSGGRFCDELRSTVD